MRLSNGHAISLTQIQGVVGRIASELAVKEPTVILFNGEKLSLSDLEKNIYVQPGLLAEFDVDELAFWIAYCLIAKKNLNKRFAWRPLRFRLWDFTSIIVLLILVFTIRALNINDNWMINSQRNRHNSLDMVDHQRLERRAIWTGACRDKKLR